ncbi:hypothetical protein ATANTOWER_004865 [Ataeniobius toweri]|uniref:Uncharacterized protein n=1 Tax=Ataeniobius toweri TaxID=208326 RepID=A0ABU7AEA2_9TELE|nr:hypothetical protein [Ataeniobius toweri]
MKQCFSTVFIQGYADYSNQILLSHSGNRVVERMMRTPKLHMLAQQHIGCLRKQGIHPSAAWLCEGDEAAAVYIV